MYITKLGVFLAVTLYGTTVFASTQHNMMDMNDSAMNHAMVDRDEMHEHGNDIFMAGSLENTWLWADGGQNIWSTSFEGWVGSDENKLFLYATQEKETSERNTFDVTALYSRNIATFWDAQAGLRYRQDDNLPQHQKRLDAVVGIHGLAPYFFETNAYLYVGQYRYSAVQLETSRDILLTQKLIAQPYLDTTWVMQDRAKFGNKTGLANVESGLKVRYEINKIVMPFIDVAYHYKTAPKHMVEIHQEPSDHAVYAGIGLLLKF